MGSAFTALSTFAALSTFFALAALAAGHLGIGPGRSGNHRRRHGGLPHLRRTRAAFAGGHPGAATAHGHQTGSGKKEGNPGTIQGGSQARRAILGRRHRQQWPGCHRWLCH
jgi:hypothetical protein